MILTPKALAVLALFLTLTFAADICPGYNFAIWRAQLPGYYLQYGIMGHGCLPIGPPCTEINPCHCEQFGCSRASVHIDSMYLEGLWYRCRKDSRLGTCGWFTQDESIESCCRNDGKKNKERGLINDEQFKAINATNALLERHEAEFHMALEKKWNIEHVKKKHEREIGEAEQREAAVGLRTSKKI